MNTTNLKRKESVVKVHVDFRDFYPVIREHYDINGYYSSRIINERTVDILLEPTIAFLIKHKHNVFNLSYSRYTELLLYFSESEFIEIFDDLQIEFSEFLSDLGIFGFERYILLRRDNFDCDFIKVGDEQFQAFIDKHTKLPPSCSEIRYELREFGYDY